MKIDKAILSLSLITLVAVGCNPKTTTTPKHEIGTSSTTTGDSAISTPEPSVKNVEFSKFNSIYRFSGEIPSDWEVDYVSSINSINIYDPKKTDNTNIEKSLIFIRSFNANSFLTLNTVSILSRTNSDINGHAAIRYEIKKKDGVANFAGQPSWRNGQHKLIDIRYSPNNPSEFYVIAYSPELPVDQFEKFITSLKFHNDSSSIKYPVNKPSKQVTKKLFGTKVSSTSSLVLPERFNDYHNAVDFKILQRKKN